MIADILCTFCLLCFHIQNTPFVQIYSFNEANSPDWESGLQNYVQDIKSGKGASGQRYSSRYIGSMVGDVHR